MKKTCVLAVVFFFLLSIPAFAERIICASTTSTQNSGLFDHILPAFKARAGIDVHVIAVGTGAALEMARRGDADVVLVHAKELELEAVSEGYFVNRRDVMFNDFAVVGPMDDAAGVIGRPDASGAFAAIAGRGAAFVSRGDKSGTHMKELAVWKAAGIDPNGSAWYLEVGQGMEKALRIASEKRAYTLTDRGTWLAVRDKGMLQLNIVFEGDPILMNQYGVMAVNPARHKHVKFKEAMAFIEWLTSLEGQALIGLLKDANGNALFIPNAAR